MTIEERKDKIVEVARKYIQMYTEAAMNGRFAGYLKEADAANDWLFLQINANHITKYEFKEAIELCEEEAAAFGTPCVTDSDLFTTKFFRG